MRHEYPEDVVGMVLSPAEQGQKLPLNKDHKEDRQGDSQGDSQEDSKQEKKNLDQLEEETEGRQCVEGTVLAHEQGRKQDQLLAAQEAKLVKIEGRAIITLWLILYLQNFSTVHPSVRLDPC